MIVFDKRKYIEVEGEEAYRRYRGWIDECHGKEVVDGRCGFYYIKPEWTVDKSKYQAGNRVLVRSDLEVGAGYGKHNFVSSMAIFKGKLVTITKVTLHGTYQLEEDSGVFYWTDEMFVGLAGSKHLVQSGDVVTTRNGNKYLAVAAGDDMVLMNSNAEGHLRLSHYDSDLKPERSRDEWDIMSIHRPRLVGFSYNFRRTGIANLIWERKEEPPKVESESKERFEIGEVIEEVLKQLEKRLSERVK